MAIGVNSPFGWFMRSVGVSAYVGLHRHFALRANVARYGREPLSGVLGTTHVGRITDYGIGAVWYPRRLWDGFMVEIGVLWRDRDTRYHPDFGDRIDTESTAYAGRAMIGWSWLIRNRAFISLAVGLSAGRESGHETVTPDTSSPMATTQDVQRDRRDAEAYLRFRFAFGG